MPQRLRAARFRVWTLAFPLLLATAAVSPGDDGATDSGAVVDLRGIWDGERLDERAAVRRGLNLGETVMPRMIMDFVPACAPDGVEEGKVGIECTIGVDGVPRGCNAVKLASHHELTEWALAGVVKARFVPLQVLGERRPALVEFTLRLERFRSRNTRVAAAKPIPPPGTPIDLLLASLRSPDERVRGGAAFELTGAADRREEIQAALRPLANDPSRSVRYAAAWASRAGATPSTYDTPPKALFMPRPCYPTRALNAGVEGTVVVEFIVGEQGEVVHPEVRASIPELDDAALASVREWRFAPASLDGRPRAALAQAPVAFRLY